MKLNPEQMEALAEAKQASDNYRDARYHLRARLVLQFERELEERRVARDVEAFRAFEAGVPKRRIGLEGLGTTDPRTINEAIEAGRVVLAVWDA